MRHFEDLMYCTGVLISP